MSDVVVDELFASSDLSDDPVFVAYLLDRPPVRAAENGAEFTRSNVQFAFFEAGEISVLTVESAEEGDMSTLLDHITHHFGVTDVVFVNVLSLTLSEKLHGFESTRRTIGGVPMDCLEGEWTPRQEVA